jgi:hypothetical protein
VTKHNGSQAAGADHQPNFELPRYGVVREDNWEEFRAKGYSVVFSDLDGDETRISASSILAAEESNYGVENVLTGDAYDYEADRPLRHKPGIGIYVSPEGREHAAKRAKRWRAERRQRAERQHQAPPDPATS